MFGISSVSLSDQPELQQERWKGKKKERQLVWIAETNSSSSGARLPVMSKPTSANKTT